MLIRNYKINKVILFLISLNILDIILTCYGLGIGLELNLVKELNPIMFHFYQINSALFILIKFIVGTGCFLVLNHLIELKKAGKLTTVFLPTVFLGVNIHNLFVVLTILKVFDS